VSGLRERNKLEKRRRIIDATLSLLAEKGFEQTTTREIAERAGVASGTIFLYAHDKLDLFLMSITEDLDPLTVSAFAEVDQGAPLVEQLSAFFRRRFEFWARWPELSRVATREMAASFSSSTSSPEMARGIKRRAQTLAKVEEMLRREQKKGGLRKDADLDSLARILLYIYLTELRFWLGSDHPRPGDAVRKFKKLATVALAGSIE
jgi:AcrR family transcriptional regulator